MSITIGLIPIIGAIVSIWAHLDEKEEIYKKRRLNEVVERDGCAICQRYIDDYKRSPHNGKFFLDEFYVCHDCYLKNYEKIDKIQKICRSNDPLYEIKSRVEELLGIAGEQQIQSFKSFLKPQQKEQTKQEALEENARVVEEAKIAMSRNNHFEALQLFKRSIEICSKWGLEDGQKWAIEQMSEIKEKLGDTMFNQYEEAIPKKIERKAFKLVSRYTSPVRYDELDIVASVVPPGPLASTTKNVALITVIRNTSNHSIDLEMRFELHARRGIHFIWKSKKVRNVNGNITLEGKADQEIVIDMDIYEYIEPKIYNIDVLIAKKSKLRSIGKMFTGFSNYKKLTVNLEIIR
jgi:hypothetical protein